MADKLKVLAVYQLVFVIDGQDRHEDDWDRYVVHRIEEEVNPEQAVYADKDAIRVNMIGLADCFEFTNCGEQLDCAEWVNFAVCYSCSV